MTAGGGECGGAVEAARWRTHARTHTHAHARARACARTHTKYTLARAAVRSRCNGGERGGSVASLSLFTPPPTSCSLPPHHRHTPSLLPSLLPSVSSPLYPSLPPCLPSLTSPFPLPSSPPASFTPFPPPSPSISLPLSLPSSSLVPRPHTHTHSPPGTPLHELTGFSPRIDRIFSTAT